MKDEDRVQEDMGETVAAGAGQGDKDGRCWGKQEGKGEGLSSCVGLASQEAGGVDEEGGDGGGDRSDDGGVGGPADGAEGVDGGPERSDATAKFGQGQQGDESPFNIHDPRRSLSPETLSDADVNVVCLLGLGRLFPVIRQDLHPSKYKPFFACIDRLSTAFLDDPTSSTALFDTLSLPRAGLTYGLSLGNKYAQHMAAFPVFGTISPRPRSSPSSVPLPDRVESEVKKGNLSRAARLLFPSNPIVTLDDAAKAKLQSLHRTGASDPFGKTIPPRHIAAFFPEADLLQTCFASIKRETALGPSGWTQPLLKLAM
jgi:hypothetical protein